MRITSSCPESSQSQSVDYLAQASYYCESSLQWPFALLLTLVLNVSGCGGEAPPADEAQPQPSALTPEIASPTEPAADVFTVLVFGDSISAAYGIDRKTGWAALLSSRLAQYLPDAQVVNASVSGETTQGGRARLAAALKRHSPDLVFLELGGNDALRGYPVKLLRDNLRAMVDAAEQAGARVVLLGMQIPPNYGPHYTRDFAAAFKTVADATSAHLVPFFLEGVALVDGMIQGDGIHPTAIAQPVLLDTGWQALVATMGDDYPSLRSDGGLEKRSTAPEGT